MKLHFWMRFLLGLILIPGVVGFSFWQLDQNGFFNVDRIDIVIEDTPATPQYLQSWVAELDKNLEQFRGVSLLKIDLQRVSDLVTAKKWVENVTLSRRFPSQIRVQLNTKEVQYVLVTRNGKLYPVVKDGSLLDAVDTRQAPDSPLLIGDLLEKNEQLRKKSVEALAQIPEMGAFSRKTISEVRFDPKEGFWMTLMKTGIKVKMGEDQISLKSDRDSQVIDYMSAHQFEARVIDANLSKKVLVRLRKDP
jgi:cell division protein FtsQ